MLNIEQTEPTCPITIGRACDAMTCLNNSSERQYPLPSIRVLVVDDFKGWLLQVPLLLQSRPELRVIAEASDGSEAVQKAKEFNPDLVVLDLNLPKLNGIEVAKQIRQRSPSSKIIFLTQNHDPDIVRAAFDTGALGYVCKPNAERELLPAVDAVLQGNQFFSSRLR